MRSFWLAAVALAVALHASGASATVAPATFNCEANVPHSKSPPNAMSAIDCICDPGYYGPNYRRNGAPCIAIQEDMCVPSAAEVALNYNAFIVGDMTAKASDTQGGLAVGGNAFLQDYDVNLLNDPFFDDDNRVPQVCPLEVGGVARLNRVTVHHGDVVYGEVSKLVGSTLLESTVMPNTYVTYDDGFLPRYENSTVRVLKFPEVATALRQWSAALAALPNTGTVTEYDSGISLAGDNSFGYNVFSINCSQLSGVDRKLNGVPENSKVIINVRCGTGSKAASWQFIQDTFPSGKHKIIWNFVDATSLQLQGINIKGIILAPNTDILAGGAGGLIEGHLFAKSFGPVGGVQNGGTLQINLLPFDGYVIPCDDLPFIPSDCVNCALDEYCDKDNSNGPTCTRCDAQVLCTEHTGGCYAPPECKPKTTAPYYECKYTPFEDGTPCDLPNAPPACDDAPQAVSNGAAINYNFPTGSPRTVSAYPTSHAFWIPSLFSGTCTSSLQNSNTWTIVPGSQCPLGAAVIKFNDAANSARMTGCIQLTVGGGYYRMKFDVSFSNGKAYVDGQNFKKELIDACYTGSGCALPATLISPSLFEYYGTVTGTLTPYSGFLTEGAVMTINKYMLDAQYGVGANGKNLNNGLSSWFTWSWNKVVFVDDNSKKCKVNANSGDHGDINIDIAQPSCTYPIGECLEDVCTPKTCEPFSPDATGTWVARDHPVNKGKCGDDNYFGLRTDGLFSNPFAGCGKKASTNVIWSFDHKVGSCIPSVKLSYNAQTNVIRVFGKVCGGVLNSNNNYQAVREGELDVTILNADKTTSNTVKAVASATTSFGYLLDKSTNKKYALRADGNFIIQKPYGNVATVFSAYGKLIYRCNSCQCQTAEFTFTVGECKSPTADIPSTTVPPCTSDSPPAQVNGQGGISNPAQGEIYTAGPTPSARRGTSLYALSNAVYRQSPAVQRSNADVADAFARSLALSIPALAGDASRVVVKSITLENGFYKIAFQINPVAGTSAAATNDAFAPLLALGQLETSVKDDASALHQLDVTNGIDVTRGVSNVVVLPPVDNGNGGGGGGDGGGNGGEGGGGGGNPAPSSSSAWYSSTAFVAGVTAGAVVAAFVAILLIRRNRRRRAAAGVTAAADDEPTGQAEPNELYMHRLSQSASTTALVPNSEQSLTMTNEAAGMQAETGTR